MKFITLFFIYCLMISSLAFGSKSKGVYKICYDSELESFPVKVETGKVYPFYVHALERIKLLTNEHLRGKTVTELYCLLSLQSFPSAPKKDLNLLVRNRNLLKIFGKKFIKDKKEVKKEDKKKEIRIPYKYLLENENIILKALYQKGQQDRKSILELLHKIKIFKKITRGKDWFYASMRVKNITDTLADGTGFLFNTASISEIKWFPIQKLKRVQSEKGKAIFNSTLQELKDSKTYYIIQNGERYLLGLIYAKGHFYLWSILMLFFTIILFWGFFEKKLWIIFYCMSLFMQMVGLVLKIFGHQNGYIFMDDQVVFIMTDLLVFMFIFLDYSQYKKMFGYAIFGNLFFLTLITFRPFNQEYINDLYFSKKEMGIYLFFIMSSAVSYTICWIMANISMADRVDNRGNLINVIDRFLIKKFLALGAIFFIFSIIGMFFQKITFYGSVLYYFQNHFWHTFYFLVSIIIIIFREKKDLSFMVYTSVFIMTVILIIQNTLRVGRYYIEPYKYIVQGTLISVLLIQVIFIIVFIKKERHLKEGESICPKKVEE